MVYSIYELKLSTGLNQGSKSSKNYQTVLIDSYSIIDREMSQILIISAG